MCVTDTILPHYQCKSEVLYTLDIIVHIGNKDSFISQQLVNRFPCEKMHIGVDSQRIRYSL